jgi:hypothetical protein
MPYAGYGVVPVTPRQFSPKWQHSLGENSPRPAREPRHVITGFASANLFATLGVEAGAGRLVHAGEESRRDDRALDYSRRDRIHRDRRIAAQVSFTREWAGDGPDEAEVWFRCCAFGRNQSLGATRGRTRTTLMRSAPGFAGGRRGRAAPRALVHSAYATRVECTVALREE